MFNSDLPISDKNNDFLGRYDFAKSIAKCISLYTSENPLVLGLYGKWGSGKSTVLNFIENEIMSDNKYIVIRFNPWWFTGHQNLAQNFIREISKVLPEKNEKFKKLGSLLNKYSQQIGEVAGFASSFIPLFGPFLEKAAQIGASEAAEYAASKIVDDLEDPSIEKSKILIQEELSLLDKKILIFFDDVDRLLPNEVVQLFSTIKGFADFKNTVYVISCDKNVVGKSLSLSTGVEDNFLNKIIQVQINIPEVDSFKLYKELSKELYDLLLSNNFKEDELPNWNSSGLLKIQSVLKTPRDITKIKNALFFTLPLVKNEVNAADFILIEIFRLFFHDLYVIIFENKSLLTNAKSLCSKNDFDKRKEELLNGLNYNSNEMNFIRDTIDDLFNYSSGQNDFVYKNINDKFYFKNYFAFNQNESGLTNKEFEKILQETDKNFKDIVLYYKDEHKLDILLDCLLYKYGCMSSKQVGNVILTLRNMYYDFSSSYNQEYEQDIDGHLYKITGAEMAEYVSMFLCSLKIFKECADELKDIIFDDFILELNADYVLQLLDDLLKTKAININEFDRFKEKMNP